MSRASQLPGATRRVLIVAAAAVALLPLAGVGSTQASTAATQATAPAVAVPTKASAAEQGPGVAVPFNVRLYRTRTSLLGTHEWYRQYRRGHLVVGGWYAVHRGTGGRVVVWDGRRQVSGALAGQVGARLDANAAERRLAAGSGHVATSPRLVVLPHPGDRPELVWSAVTRTSAGVFAVYLDTRSGAVVRRTPIARFAEEPPPVRITGRGRVFDPNPVVARQRPLLKDLDDRTTEQLRAAYKRVDLPRLTRGAGLAGRWVRIMNDDRAVRDNNVYLFSRTDNRFEQVVSYHALDSAQAYLHEIGFTDVNASAQKVFTNDFRGDNSFYDPMSDSMHMGSGGVDDAEDVEVLWHEYGHAIQDDQVPMFGGSLQAGAIGEGFGDYLAVTLSQPNSPDTAKTPIACVADWDAVSYDRSAPHCLRRVDSRKTFADRSFEVHDDGMIWSRALWDINRRLVPTAPGLERRDMANRIIVEAQFWMNPRITMRAAARITVDTARRLYGDAAADVVRQAFLDRRILSG